MKIHAANTYEDIAYIVCSTLQRAGVTAVLSGGGAATIYAPDAYQSRDLDFILMFSASAYPPEEQLLLDLGFKRARGAGTYGHPESPYTVEFPHGPLAVGEELIKEWATLRKGELLLHVLSPTDCVRDRLAAAIHWNDLSSISQAAAVARRHPVDMPLIETWCRSEGGEHTFAIFKARLQSNEA